MHRNDGAPIRRVGAHMRISRPGNIAILKCIAVLSAGVGLICLVYTNVQPRPISQEDRARLAEMALAASRSISP
jgi:hypothetical protein